MNYHSEKFIMDQGPEPAVCNVPCAAKSNTNFRTTIWTGCHVQMTVMCLAPCEDIGEEIHENLDQIIRIEYGRAYVMMGRCPNCSGMEIFVKEGDAIFIPAGTWHNVKNVGRCPLRISSVYAPPEHPKGTVDVEKSEHY